MSVSSVSLHTCNLAGLFGDGFCSVFCSSAVHCNGDVLRDKINVVNYTVRYMHIHIQLYFFHISTHSASVLFIVTVTNYRRKVYTIPVK